MGSLLSTQLNDEKSILYKKKKKLLFNIITFSINTVVNIKYIVKIYSDNFR